MRAFTKLRRSLEPVAAFLERYDSGAAWRPAAEANGLTGLQEQSFLWMTRLVTGRKGPLHVRFERVGGDDHQPHLQITVRGLVQGLAVRTEGLGDRIQKRLGLGEDIETGDARFDADFLIQGGVPVAHALLDADTRGALKRVFGAHHMTMLAAGTLLVQFAPDYDAVDLDDELARILDLAQRLVQPDDVAARIARNALEDDTEDVRRRCLLELLAHHRHHAATRETLRRACGDASEDVRLEAAVNLQEEGHSVLRALASSAGSEACAVRAIEGLGVHFEAAEVLALLDTSLERGRHAVAAAAIDTLGRRGSASVPAAFEALLLRRGLLRMEESVRLAAAAALARVGTVAAVLPLQEAAQRAGGALRRAVQDATRAIQSRLSGAERGQLTVSDAEGGTVTLAAEGGQVSLPDSDGSRRD